MFGHNSPQYHTAPGKSRLRVQFSYPDIRW